MRRNMQSYASCSKKRAGRFGWRKFLREECGNSIIEVALMMPLFSLALFGSAEFGRLFFDAIEVSNAAYAGASYGAQTRYTAANTSAIQLAATNDATDVSGMTAVATASCTCTNGTTVTCSTAASLCVSPARILEYVQVNTAATVNPGIHFVGSPTTF